MKKLLILVVLALLVLVVSVGTGGAAPLGALLGPQPLYDSGWVLTTDGDTFQTFTHNLDAFPTHIEIYVGDDSSGSYASVAYPNRYVNGTYSGGSAYDVFHDTLEVYWYSGGIAYNNHQEKWYMAGEDYARVLVFSADEMFSAPERP